jgi:hypothetical protein
MKNEEQTQEVAVIEQQNQGVAVAQNPSLMRVDTETGEQFPTLASSNDVLSMQNKAFIHIQPDCSASAGRFKIGDTDIGKEMKATLIAVMPHKNVAMFTKKGEEPKYQDWVHLLFVDEKHGNLKSTLIKTRSILGIIKLIQAAMAVNESPIGLSFVMRFADATGKNPDTGEVFKYKFLTFEKNESKSEYEQMAIDIRHQIDTGLMEFPSLDSLL